MKDVLRRGGGEDDDIVENPHGDYIQVFSKDVIHEVLEHGWSICRPLWAELVLEMPLPSFECCLPLVPLFHSHLMIGISQVYFGEDLGEVEAVQHFRYEGEGEPFFDCNPVQTPVIDNQVKLAIWALHKHNRGWSWRLRWANEAISKVRGDVFFHFC